MYIDMKETSSLDLQLSSTASRSQVIPSAILHSSHYQWVNPCYGIQIGKGVRQGCILSPCLFNLYAEYIMRKAGLDEAQAGIKIAGRNINNLRYADDTTWWQKVKN